MDHSQRQSDLPSAEILRFPVERTVPARLLTLSELMERFGFSERWWRYRIAAGLPCHRWGGGLRFNPAEVQVWLDGVESEANKAAPATRQRPGAWPRPTRRS
jgi:hypothetical protein